MDLPDYLHVKMKRFKSLIREKNKQKIGFSKTILDLSNKNKLFTFNYFLIKKDGLKNRSKDTLEAKRFRKKPKFTVNLTKKCNSKMCVERQKNE